MKGEKQPHKFWDRVSGWSKAETAANSTLVRHIDSLFGRNILPGDSVLDFGCGTGTITLRIAANTRHVHGVDVSGGMLSRAIQHRDHCGARNADFSRISDLKQMFPPNAST